MQLTDYEYRLPKALIAHFPLKDRTASRLLQLQLSKDVMRQYQFNQLVDLLKPNDLLVFNNTKVIPARLFGVKDSSGKVEVLVERVLSDDCVLAHVKASKNPKPRSKLILEDVIEAIVIEKRNDLFVLQFSGRVFPLLERYGHVPLPPYIERLDESLDKERYQTVYAKEKGAVAAPTAGLHFDEPLLKKISEKNVAFAYITLHVGAGTFQPLRVDDIKQHKMHSEFIDVPPLTCEKIKKTKQLGGRVIAVGTTVVRALETAHLSGQLKPYAGETDIFIYPGFTFQSIDGMITNFHLPKSSLLMLVCAFGGYQRVMRAYQEAIRLKYRFYSYGDAMLLL